MKITNIGPLETPYSRTLARIRASKPIQYKVSHFVISCNDAGKPMEIVRPENKRGPVNFIKYFIKRKKFKAKNIRFEKLCNDFLLQHFLETKTPYVQSLIKDGNTEKILISIPQIKIRNHTCNTKQRESYLANELIEFSEEHNLELKIIVTP